MFDIKTDKTGFPIIEIAQIGLTVSWLPMTKIQLEHYIADTNNPNFNRSWYDDICRLNPRQAPNTMDIGRYEGVFVTGILPREAQLIAQWMGYGYDLPTADEWKLIFDHLYAMDATPEILQRLKTTRGLSARALQMIARLDSLTVQNQAQLLGETRRVCDQLLMRLGIMEYVYENSYRNSYAGQGLPNRLFHPHTRILPRDRAETLAESIRKSGSRIKQYGVRLIIRS